MLRAPLLLDVARSAGSGQGRAALAMARRAQLEGRLLAVLDPRIDRRPAGRRAATVAGCAAALVVMPLAAVRAERAAAQRSAVVATAEPVAAAVSAVQAVQAVQAIPAAPSTSAAPRPKKLAQVTARTAPTPPAPPTPPTPPTPATPPTPPTPPSSHSRGTHVIDDGNGTKTWTSSWSDGNRSTVFSARGEIRWNEEASDVSWISPGGSLDLTIHENGRHWHAEIFPGPSGLSRTLLIDGSPRAWDAQWFAHALEDLDRHSAFAADIRFPRLYRQGGARAVLDYVRTMEGDYARRRYLQLLVERDPLEDATAVAVFRAVQDMSGDYDRAEVLKSAAAKARLDTDRKREAFLAACSGISGDYERGRVLRELIVQPRLSPELARAVLSAAAKMSGDYEKAQALTALVQRHPVDAQDYLRAAAKVSGDYEHARVLKALIGAQKLDGAGQMEVIRQARHLGDYESAEVLLALTGSVRLTPDAQRDYEDAAEHLGDYSRKRVLAALRR